MSKKTLLLGASTLIAAVTAMAGSANAANAIYGGGSTLISAYIRQAEDCYGLQTPQTPLVNQGSVLTGAGANDTLTTPPLYDYVGAPAHPQNCNGTNVNDATTLAYIGSGSGNGRRALYSHDPVTFWGDVSGNSNGLGNTFYPNVDYAASDAGLAGTDVANYNCVGSSLCTQDGSVHIIGTTDTTDHVTGTTYANPGPLYGNIIQFPVVIAPVALSYASTYKVVTDGSGNPTYYHFHIKAPNKDGSGGLVLDMPTVCKIFNGQITNWNDPALKTLNSNTSLQDVTDPAGASAWTTTGLPIEMVGRSDSSGTTSIFYRALAAQCTGTNAYLPAGSQTLPGGLIGGPVYAGGANYTQTAVSGQFSRATGSSGVAAYLNFELVGSGSGQHPLGASATYSQGRIGYIGPDFTLPAVVHTGANAFGLNIADIKVGTAKIEPTASTALKAFGTGAAALLPPQSSSNGSYLVTATANGLRASQQDWVEPISTTEILSNSGGVSVPTPLAHPTTAGAYPIVGTSNAIFYSCYNDTAQAGKTAQITAFLTYYLGFNTTFPKTVTDVAPTHQGILAAAGLSPLPAAWLRAIDQTFVTPVTKGTVTTNQLNLAILAAGSGPATGTGSQCHSVTPGA